MKAFQNSPKELHKKLLCLSLLTVVTFSVYTGNAGAQSSTSISIRNLDRNGDSVITLKEWQIETAKYFTNTDSNRDGILSGNELKSGTMNSTNSSDPFRAKDKNHDGVIVLKEWSGNTSSFQRLDSNNNGQLSVDEFHARTNSDQFSELDHNGNSYLTGDEWHKSNTAFVNLDRNRDKRISRDEFYNKSQYPTSIFGELDVNNNKIISRNEWHDEIVAFNRIDTNNDNVLTAAEFNSQQNTSTIEKIFNNIFKTQ